MSAIAVVRRETAIVIAYDSIAYNSEGIVTSVAANKVIPIPELGCVIGNTGVGQFTSFLRVQMAQQHRNFDEVLDTAPADFQIALAAMRHLGLAQESAACTAVYAGWSDKRQRFETYRISATAKEVRGFAGTETIPAFTLAPIPGDWCSKAYNLEDEERFGLTRPDISAMEIAAGFVCAARAASLTEASADGSIDDTYAVGGRLHVIILERGKLTCLVAHQWPDEPGSRLDPTAGEPMPAWLLGNADVQAETV